MITLYNAQGAPAHYLSDIENFCIVHTYEGNDSLSFDISPKHPLYEHIAEQIQLQYGENFYVVKGINERSERSSISAELDLEQFKDTFFTLYEPAQPVTVTEVLEAVLPGDFTILSEADLTKTRTIKLEHVTGLDILNACQEEFGLVYQWNLARKRVTLVDPSAQTARGVYLTDELNLESVSFKGDSSDFVTRLYPFGKDGQGIESTGDGLPYVENFTYADRVVCGYWSDTSYEDMAQLREAAVQKLSALCCPVRSYECSVIDLAKLNEDYAQLAFSLYDIVTLIDRNRKTRVDHQIVEYKEYPDEPRRNVVTLSNRSKTIKSSIESSIKNVVTEVDSAKSALQIAIENATQAITGNSGGHVVIYPPEKPEEILIMDEPSIEQARNVWRWNKEGLGHSSNGYNGPYSLAILADGEINADFITAGSLNAGVITSGVLKDKTGSTRINLDEGSFNFGNGQLVLQNNKLNMAGTIESNDGVIAGWDITETGFIGKNSYAGMCSSDVHAGIAYWAGAPSGQQIGDANVLILHNGEIAAKMIKLSTKTGGIQFEIVDDDNLYIQSIKDLFIGTTKCVRVMYTNRQSYMPLYASNVNSSSSERYKCNIEEFDRSALALIKKGKIYEYNLNIEVEQAVDREAAPKHLGFVVERETPAEVMDDTGEAVCLNHTCAVLWKAAQEQQQLIEQLQQRIDALEQGKGE